MNDYGNYLIAVVSFIVPILEHGSVPQRVALTVVMELWKMLVK